MLPVASKAGTGDRYATQVGALWNGLAGTLTRLEALAAEPDRLEDEKQLDLLRRLPYALHTPSQHALRPMPPPPPRGDPASAWSPHAGPERVHAGRAAALAGARDATAQVVEAVDDS